MVFRNMVIFYGEELLAPRPIPKLEDHPLRAVRDCIFATTLPIRRPFLHPQPEDAPCRGDRDPIIMVEIQYVKLIISLFYVDCIFSKSIQFNIC
jgi:hypothetical protein